MSGQGRREREVQKPAQKIQIYLVHFGSVLDMLKLPIQDRAIRQ